MQASIASDTTNGMHSATQVSTMSDSLGAFPLGYAPRENGQKREIIDDDSDSESEKVTLPQPPVKKTKGRVKIKMEFIDNKLRRYTTFSKRKTGIMKKAYELSTLTGTQVMLLVASETGHVYTFATRKLQPMITSESGKALIQTCLNSPDPPPVTPGQQSDVDQRMNPTGFEEPELSCTVNEEESKSPEQNVPKPFFINQNRDSYPQSSSVPQTLSVTTYLPSASTSAPPGTSANKPANISMQLPASSFVLPGTPQIATPMGLVPIQQSNQQQGQTVYRFPNNQLLALSGVSNVANSSGGGAGDASNSTVTLTNITPASAPVNNNSTTTNTAQPVMYHTPQGVVYAAPSTVGNLSEGFIFNFPQTPTALTIPDQQASGQQYITIPVPVSIANSQVIQPVITTTEVNQDGNAQK